jgi:hypothetical protein
MAHILVYLQRTPQGIHPASALALCLARDIGSERGATITGVCAGDAGALDRGMLEAANRFGSDIVMFGGLRSLADLQERLHPVHVLTPWTPEGLAAVQGLPGGPPVLRWLDRSDPPWAGADAITGIVAGTLPWHSFAETLEAEYAGDVDQVPLPDWVEAATEQATETPPPVFQISGAGPVGYVAPDVLDAGLQRGLEHLGAERTTLEGVAASTSGTYLWLAPGAGRIPEELLAARSPATRVVLLPGPDAKVDATWSVADWVFGGPWPDVVETLIQTTTAGGPWQMGPG